MAHPLNPRQFIVCPSGGGHATVMDCPEGLVFNRYLDRCDFTADPITGCSQQPCQYGSTCVDLPDFDYRCICLPGFSGSHCDQAPDVCALQPCGSNGRCHTMSPGSPIPYYCTCFDEQAFGIGCESQRLEGNPCLLLGTSAFYLTRLDQALFVQCDDRKMYLRFCSRPLVFSIRSNACVYVKDANEENIETTTTTTQATTTTTGSYFYPINPYYYPYG